MPGGSERHGVAVQDRVAHPEARAPLYAAVHLADEVDHDRRRGRDLRRLVLVEAPAETTHERPHVGLVPPAHVEAHLLRREEVDVDVLGAHARVFGDVVDDLLALVADGHAGVEQARLRPVVDVHAEVVRRVPDAVAQTLDGVPGEPPVDHVHGHAGHLVAHGDVAGAVVHHAPADLGLEVAGVEQPAHLLRRQHLVLRDRAVRGHQGHGLRVRARELHRVEPGVGPGLLLGSERRGLALHRGGHGQLLSAVGWNG